MGEYANSPEWSWLCPLDGTGNTLLASNFFSRTGGDGFESGMVSWFDWETDCQEMSGFQFSISSDVLFPAPDALFPAPDALTSGLCFTFFPSKVFDAFRLVVAFALVDTFAHGITSSF